MMQPIAELSREPKLAESTLVCEKSCEEMLRSSKGSHITLPRKD
jgi:hypothetical protein